ncbi:MAG: alpha-2-macroglobulin family protein [Dysgonomonas sp.]|nr:alpha-2-macroglobulin family protein [Dysgonomonas sp.]
MRKKIIFIGLLLITSITLSAQMTNNKYEEQWKQVAENEDLSLPQSASKVVDKILQEAIADNNNIQAIKALIYKNKYKKQIDKDDRENLITDFQNLIGKTTNQSEKALLHSMLAELYADYYNNNRWQINRRTNLTGTVPEDIREWPRNIFADKIAENIALSVKEEATLKKHTTKEYDDIIKLGNVAQKYYPTLYDFLKLRSIGIAKLMTGYYEFDPSLTSGIEIDKLTLPAREYITLDIKENESQGHILNYYQEYLKDLLSRNMTPTVILLDIDRIAFLGQNSRTLSGDKLAEAYTSLYENYKENDTAAEIIDRLTSSFGYNYKAPEGNNKKIYEWLQKGTKDYPNYEAINKLKNRLVDLEMPALSIKGSELQYPGKDIKLEVLHKNIQAMPEKPVFTLYKVENKEYSVVREYPLTLASSTTYSNDTLSLSLGELPFGDYCFSILSKDVLEDINSKEYRSNAKFDFTVSALISYFRNSARNEYEIFVVDRISGKPVKNAEVKIYSNNKADDNSSSPLAVLQTNELGLAIYKDKNENKNDYYRGKYKVSLGNDTYSKEVNIYGNDYQWVDNNNTNENTEEYVSVFTDRGIYRPGQTVYFKAIATDSKSKLITNKVYDVKLYNVNDDVVAEKQIFTNEFGSISGEFVLPPSGLLGQYHIDVDGEADFYFNVEEYKRPTFEITFDKIDKTYSFGEEITLKGYAKNFSGISLQDAEVTYNINRQQFSLWPWRSGNQSPFADGTVQTKEDGSFEIVFTPEAGDGNKPLFRIASDKQIYTFDVTATVTDLNGETQSNTFSITVGNVSMVINIDIPDQIEKSSDSKINIEARNLQAQPIETSGTYALYTLDEKDVTGQKVFESSFKTGEQAELINKLKSIASGKYRLQVKATDSKGNEIEEKKDFILYAYSDKKPPIKTDEWFVQKNTKFAKGKDAEIIFGTLGSERYVLYQLTNKGQVFERRIVKVKDSNYLIKIPYKAEYGDAVNMSLTSVKDGRLYSQNIQLMKEEEKADINLNIKLEVFRDKLRPGEAETWTISVKDAKENPVAAELLASMYDTSLDKLYPYSPWGMNRPYTGYSNYYPVSYNFSWYNSDYPQRFALDYQNKYFEFSPRTIDIVNWFDYIYTGNNDILKGVISSSEGRVVAGRARKMSFTGSTSVVKANEMAVPSAAQGEMMGVAADLKTLDPAFVMTENAVAAGDPNEMELKGGALQQEAAPAPQIRQNFNETAFFYPQLRTNEKGETLISFTVPESNTTWRFRALAHDKDLRTGTLEQMVVTRKELMVTPNMPRFVRQGDKTSISTKISNLSNIPTAGKVRIEFFDPITDKLLDLGPKQGLPFVLDVNESVSARWTIDIPSDIDMIGCRIVAESETFSDGEQHVLAVLPNRMLVTETMPIDVTDAGKSTFTFDKLIANNSSTLQNYKLTLEYASNPAWYAVQALPTMSNPSNENAVNWFASYYVNTLGSSIVRQYPKVAAMIQAWKKQGGDKETLVSNLQKNEELKAVLLEETPWVLDAKDETVQMQRLSLLFDLNNTKQLTDAATRKLSELMTSDGGWAWYKGLFPNRSVTQYILYGYASLQKTGQVQYPQEIKEMQMKALRYIDGEILKDYENLKKNNKNWEKTSYVSTNQLEFAYVRSFYRDIPIDQKTREAERFYTDVASKNWTKLGLYEKSILSAVLERNGDKQLAAKVVKSIREHAVQNKSLGMYWPNNKGRAFMSMSAISTHTFLMEALYENGASEKEMDMMKRWLLKQKQTQVWESTHATIDAINALLSTGNDWFGGEVTATKISVGGKTVEPDNKEAGTGYFKTSWNKSEINNNMGKVEVEQQGTQPAYGAMYWQYFENLDKITSHSGELNINKELYKETNGAAGKSLVAVSESNPLTVGDKVVMRLVVRVDRDMEFVQLKDMRAPCFEPIQTVSGVKWADGTIYYQTTRDASTNFYFDRLPKGTYVLEYPVYVNRSGEYANGITSIQCLYAPEFTSHTQGIKVVVKEK